MKPLTILLLMQILLQSTFAGPWYEHPQGISVGDKTESPIPLKDRIYVIMRSAPASGHPDVLAKILQPTDARTLAEVMQKMKGSFPKDYPKTLFVIVYRAEASYDGAYSGSMAKALKSTFEVRARDVIWIGFSI